jgi:hypothetical protein
MKRIIVLGTPNRATPVPQTNLFSTSPGLEQQPGAPKPPAASAGAAGGSRQGAPADQKAPPIRP